MHQKLVIVGDSGCGKTSLLDVFTKGAFAAKHTQTVTDSRATEFEVGDAIVSLTLWDTGGQSCYDRLRPLTYDGADVILLCFAVDCPNTLTSIYEQWIYEVCHYVPGVPVLLVGCKVDLRFDKNTLDRLEKLRLPLVSSEEGTRIARLIGASKYLECSAKTREGVAEVFRTAVRCAFEYRRERSSSRPRRSKRCICL